MIFSKLKMFADKQVVALANDTNGHTVVLTNQIDLGKSQKGYRVTRALKRNIGMGCDIPLQANINQLSTGVVLNVNFILDTSPDNATWTTIFTSKIVTGVGGQLNIDTLPEGTDRYIRMKIYYKISAGNAANKTMTVTSALATPQRTPDGAI